LANIRSVHFDTCGISCAAEVVDLPNFVEALDLLAMKTRLTQLKVIIQSHTDIDEAAATRMQLWLNAWAVIRGLQRLLVTMTGWAAPPALQYLTNIVIPAATDLRTSGLEDGLKFNSDSHHRYAFASSKICAAKRVRNKIASALTSTWIDIKRLPCSMDGRRMYSPTCGVGIVASS
jgi:hypothetical protein